MLLRCHVGLVASGESFQINEVGKKSNRVNMQQKARLNCDKAPWERFRKHSPLLVTVALPKRCQNIDNIMTLRAMSCGVENTLYVSAACYHTALPPPQTSLSWFVTFMQSLHLHLFSHIRVVMSVFTQVRIKSNWFITFKGACLIDCTVCSSHVVEYYIIDQI